jgi:hypothetical protein
MSSSDTADLTPEEAIREAAWQQALNLYRRLEDAERSASGGLGGAGYRDPHARDEARRLRTQLDEIVHEHGFYGTRADVLGLSWTERQAAPWTRPAERRELPANRCPECYGAGSRAGGKCSACNGSGRPA